MASERTSTIEVLPSARRLIHSLRDLGYDFPQAVADLVDNSISANATRVDVDVVFAGPDSWVRIVDDGDGMSGDDLTEAMRYGTSQVYDDEALGRFGLGLKTASLSQCRKLTVGTRRGQRVEARQLDLDHVIDSNRWEILRLTRKCLDQRVSSVLKDAGTVVLWESLDRLLGYKIAWGRHAEKAVLDLAAALMTHLGMIFHRFLCGAVPGRSPLRMYVNGERVDAWDPFALQEDATEILPAREFDLETDSGVGLVRFQPYVLPPRELFSSDAAFDLASGPRRWNAQQGLYIYRANRLIQSGGWCRLRTMDEHVKLARASLDFFPELDSAFGINVAKVRVLLPSALRERLGEALEPLVRAAQARYREHGRSRSKPRGLDSVLPRALEQAARKTGDLAALRRIRRQLKTMDPGVATKLGW